MLSLRLSSLPLSPAESLARREAGPTRRYTPSAAAASPQRTHCGSARPPPPAPAGKLSPLGPGGQRAGPAPAASRWYRGGRMRGGVGWGVSSRVSADPVRTEGKGVRGRRRVSAQYPRCGGCSGQSAERPPPPPTPPPRCPAAASAPGGGTVAAVQ